MRIYVKADETNAQRLRKKHLDAQERRKEKQGNRNSVLSIINEEGKSVTEKVDELFDMLVPSSGTADTKAGELIRAIVKIMYRDYNDGDVFYSGYGIETCGNAASYISENTDEAADEFYQSFVRIAEEGLEGDKYTDAINEVASDLLEYIKENPQVITEKNEDDMLKYDGSDWRNFEPKYDFECEIPEMIQDYIDKEYMDYRDFQEWLESLVEYNLPDSPEAYVNSWARDAYTIEDLCKSDYDEITENYDRWCREYVADKEEEFSDMENEDEEEYEEEEE